jgi:flagellar motility protein MotE (MotC chaperone)
MAAATTIALVSLGIAAAGAGVGAYSAVKQGQFQQAAAEQQASEMEIQAQAYKTQRAGEQVDEASQRLDRARQLDSLFREQRVAAASSGLMGGSFSAIQAKDLSAYSREQNLTSIYTSAKDSNAALQLDSMKRQIASTRASGNFAQQMGMLNAAGGLLSAGYSAGAGYAQYKSKQPKT